MRIGSFQMVDQPAQKEDGTPQRTGHGKPKLMGFTNHVSGTVFQIMGNHSVILLQNFNLKRVGGVKVRYVRGYCCLTYLIIFT